MGWEIHSSSGRLLMSGAGGKVDVKRGLYFVKMGGGTFRAVVK